MRKHILPTLAALVVLGATNTGLAANMDSTYTDLNLDECLVLSADDFGAQFACPGYKGYPVYVAEGDLRFFVSFGFGAPDERAASQTLPAFNTLNTTMEWRLSDASGDWKPFATILRWFTQSGDGVEPDGQTLVVTKLEPGNTCHIAYVDAKRTPNANEIARQWADSVAAGFNCETDEPYQTPN